MKKKFKIAHKLMLAFGSLMLAMMINAYFINITVNQNKELNRKFRKIYEPSAVLLENLYIMINNSKLLVKNWVYIDKKEDTPDKIALQELHSKHYPEIRNKIDSLMQYWHPEDQKTYVEIKKSIDTLFQEHRLVMDTLRSFERYDDAMCFFAAVMMVENGGDVIVHTDNILNKLNGLVLAQKKIMQESNAEMTNSFNSMNSIIILLTIILGLSLVGIAFITIRSIVKPMVYIQNITLDMARGILPANSIAESADEVGQMAKAINILADSFKKTSKFALTVGQGNFASDFKPLSEHDILGNSLINMRESLKQAKHEEEQRNWASQGLARFGEVLGKHQEIQLLTQNVLKFLIEYIHGFLGRIYVFNDDDLNDTSLQLLAYYPDDNPYKNQIRLYPQQSIIGEFIREKQTKYIKDLPADYQNLEREYGEKIVLLIVPLTVEDELIGVIEICSFLELQQNQIEFVERAAGRIASTLFLIKTNARTVRMLEQSIEQQRQLEIQEEQLHQHIEELRTITEELEDVNEQLRRNEEILEQKVIERTAEVVKQKEIIEDKNRELTSGINYAKRIQEAMLPQLDILNEKIADHFILFKPRDIVSGDFYYCRVINQYVIVAAADCTGHGVPGGFMSMLGISLLNEITRNTTNPEANIILNKLRKNIKTSLKQTGKDREQKDGMDIAFCIIDTENHVLQFAGAYNSLLIVRQENENINLTEIKADKMPIGIYSGEEKDFKNNYIPLIKGDCIYLYSDGYIDQFGGKKGRKFLLSNFKELIKKNCSQTMYEQKYVLGQIIENWIIGYERPDKKINKQLDDILVIGLRY